MDKENRLPEASIKGVTIRENSHPYGTVNRSGICEYSGDGGIQRCRVERVDLLYSGARAIQGPGEADDYNYQSDECMEQRDCMSLDPYDYLKIQVQMDFGCQRCGACCQVADPIDIYPKDIRRLASYFDISPEEAIEEYTIPHPSEPDIRAFKASAPCRFYDKTLKGCQIYPARPMVCRCSPFLSPGQIGLEGLEIYEDCPASAESIKRVERDLDLLLSPDSKTKKKLEKALSKMMQFE